MNRLTKRAKNGLAYIDIPLNQSSVLDANENIVKCYTGFIADRLAAYEDTGRRPEDFLILENELEAYKEEYLKYKDLEKQCLLIKLPCKVGDVVYLLGGKDYNKFRVGCVDWKSGMEYKGKNYQLYMEDNYYDKAYRNFSDIGKTVFLTREEAEKVLEKTNDKNS